MTFAVPGNISNYLVPEELDLKFILNSEEDMQELKFELFNFTEEKIEI